MPTSKKTSEVRNYAPYLTAIAGGALAPFAFAPHSYFVAIIASLALLVHALAGVAQASSAPLQSRTVLRSALVAWCYGTGSFVFGTFWLTNSLEHYGNLSFALSAAVILSTSAFIGLWYGLFGALWSLVLRLRMPWRTVYFAITFTLCEWLRVWIDPGLPWLMVGTAALDTSFANLLPIGGVYLATFAVAFAGYFAEKMFAFRRHPRRAAQAFVVIAALWVLAGTIPPMPIDSGESAPLKVRLVQPALDIHKKWDRGGFNYSWQKNIRETEDFEGDLVLWPETSLPGTLKHDVVRTRVDTLRDKPYRVMTGLLTKHGTDSGETGLYNSVYLFGAMPSEDQRIDKRKLMPFGEYMPLEPITKFIFAFLNIPGPRIHAAPMRQELIGFGEHRIAALVCLEIAYPQIARRTTSDANILVTVANDTWFGDTRGPHQHFEIARVRALEMGITVLRLGNDGITAVINQHGEVVGKIEQFASGHLDLSLAPQRQNTLWSRYDTLVVVILVLALLLASAGARFVRWKLAQLEKERMAEATRPGRR